MQFGGKLLSWEPERSLESHAGCRSTLRDWPRTNFPRQLRVAQLPRLVLVTD